MPTNGDTVEPYVAENRLLRIHREVKVRVAGLIVTHSASNQGSMPVKFQIYDSFPGDLDVKEIGYHPDHEPSHGHIDGEMAVFGGLINPGEEFTVVYGICQKRPRTLADIEEVQSNSPLNFEVEQIVGPEGEIEAELAHATSTRSSAPDESDRLSSSLGTLWQKTHDQAKGSDGDEPGTPAPDTVNDGPGAAEATADEHWINALFGEEPPEPANTPSSASREETTSSDRVSGGDPFGQSTANGKLAAEISRLTRRQAGSPEGQSLHDANNRDSTDSEYTPHESVAETTGARRQASADWDPLGGAAQPITPEFEPGKVPALAGDRYEGIRDVLAEIGELEAAITNIQVAVYETARIDELLERLETRQEVLLETVDRLESDLDSTSRGPEVDQVDSVSESVTTMRKECEWMLDELAARRAIQSAKQSQLAHRLNEIDRFDKLIGELEDELSDTAEVVRDVERQRRNLLRMLRGRDIDSDT